MFNDPDDHLNDMLKIDRLQFPELNHEPPPRPVHLWFIGTALAGIVLLLGFFLLRVPIGQPLMIVSLLVGLVAALLGIVYLVQAITSRNRFIYVAQQEALDLICLSGMKGVDPEVLVLISKLQEAGAYREASSIRNEIRRRGEKFGVSYGS